VLLTCYTTRRLYRMSLADGTVVSVAGHDTGAGSTIGSNGEVPAHSVSLNAPTSIAVAPRELWRDGDALALLLSDREDVWVIRVPY
jgi:hypothetical protein